MSNRRIADEQTLLKMRLPDVNTHQIDVSVMYVCYHPDSTRTSQRCLFGNLEDVFF